MSPASQRPPADMDTQDHHVEHICSECQASFTRKTHLTRHLRSHTNQRTYACALCGRATFTRSDLLTRHVKRCSLNPGGVPPSRKKCCLLCIQRKVKCDLQKPCGKCAARGMQCVYSGTRSPEAEMDPGPSTLRMYSEDLSSSSGTPASIAASPPRSPEGHRVPVVGGPTEPPPESFEDRPLFIDQPLGSTFPFLGLFDANQDSQSIPSPNPNTHPCPAKDSDRSTISHSGPPMNSESIFDVLLSDGVPPPDSSAVPLETVLEINALFFDEFLNQAPTPSVQNLESPFTSFNITPAFSPFGAMVKNPTPDIDSYLARFFSFHCRLFPFVHVPTWCESSAPLLLVRAMQASGALYVTGSTEGKSADQYIIDTLQSNLRQDIFRKFIDTPTDDVDTQASLILALASLQSLGLFHRSQAERCASTAYHGMVVTMIRKSALPATLESWNLGDIESPTSAEAWVSWARYETMKRVLLLVYMHDTLMPVFHNLPSCLGENELPFRLPCDDALWEAPDAQRWAVLAATDPSALRGVPLHSQLSVLLNPHPDATPAPLNRFTCFVTIHALLRAAALARGSHAPLQGALRQWYACWLAGGGGQSSAGEQPNFTSSVLPLYWLAQLLSQLDGADPVSRVGHLRYATVKQWLKEFWGLLRASGQIGVAGIADPAGEKPYTQDIATPEGLTGSEREDEGLLGWVLH